MNIKPKPGPAKATIVVVMPSMLRFPVSAIDFYPMYPSQQTRANHKQEQRNGN